MGRHWSQTAGGCIRSTPEQSRRPPPSACGSRRCVEGRCRRCRPLDSCAPRAVRSTQLSTLRPREHAPANLAAAATMESCPMTLRGCPSLGTRSPVQASVPGELSAAVPQRRVLMRPTLAWDQWQRPGCRRHHRGVVRSPWDTRTRWVFYYVKDEYFFFPSCERNDASCQSSFDAFRLLGFERASVLTPSLIIGYCSDHQRHVYLFEPPGRG